MIDVETIFDSDREEYEFMQEKKEKPMNEPKLNPCPFCGCEDVRIVPLYEDIWSVRCNDCSTQLRTLTLNDNQFLEQEGNR